MIVIKWNDTILFGVPAMNWLRDTTEWCAPFGGYRNVVNVDRVVDMELDMGMDLDPVE